MSVFGLENKQKKFGDYLQKKVLNVPQGRVTGLGSIRIIYQSFLLLPLSHCQAVGGYPMVNLRVVLNDKMVVIIIIY